MLAATDHRQAPWHIVAADYKRHARIALISDLLGRPDYCDKDPAVLGPDNPHPYSYGDALAGRRALAR
ncbi:MAG: hypothetical protein J4A00_08825 [Gammaproteobacteria bacterium]|nr:hypothetical protein [Gammaproteobacteria bacterium]